jgi:hypothetical protein
MRSTDGQGGRSEERTGTGQQPNGRKGHRRVAPMTGAATAVEWGWTKRVRL